MIKIFSKSELEAHTIKSEEFVLPAMADLEGYVYWPAPGCKRVYDKSEAEKLHKSVRNILRGPNGREPDAGFVPFGRKTQAQSRGLQQ